MNIKELKRQKESNFEKLTKAVTSLNKGAEANSKDTSFWQPTVDKMGNGYAVIRFLPAPKGEDLPFVRIWDHGFQGPGGWYIEKSLTTIGKEDPVSEYNSKLWNSSSDDDSPERKQARKQKRRLSYVSNIYVVSDPGNKENEGKVFRYKYGKKIFEKINDMMHPVHPDEEAMNPFDFWEGANFKLKIRQVDGYRNYDKSEFERSAPLADDAELEEIWNTQYSLNALIADSEFKTYDQLKARLALVLGESPRQRSNNDEESAPAPKQRSSSPPNQKAAAPARKPVVEDDEEEDTMEFFKRIAEEDE